MYVSGLVSWCMSNADKKAGLGGFDPNSDWKSCPHVTICLHVPCALSVEKSHREVVLCSKVTCPRLP